MKKVLLVSALVLVIATSMVSGTLAVYNHTITTVANGEVTAKNFILIGEDTTGSPIDNLYIAPGETSTFTFTVSNFEVLSSGESIISEVPMNLSIDIGLAASSGKIGGAIVPLTVDVFNELGNPLTAIDATSFSDELIDLDSGETRAYTVEITWPDDGDDDSNYAGHDYGTALTVKVTGTQK